MYRVYRNQAAPAYSSLYFFIFLSLQIILTLKIFVTLFSGTVRPRRLKLGTYVDSGQIYRVYRKQAVAAYLSLYVSFLFLSNFQTRKFFVTLFSGTVRPRRLKLCIHVDSGHMYRVIGYTPGKWMDVYRNHAAARIRPFIFSFFFLSNFQTLKYFATLFSGTVRPRRLTVGICIVNLLHTWKMGGCVPESCCCSYSSFCVFIFLSLQFSNIKHFRHIFLRNCEA